MTSILLENPDAVFLHTPKCAGTSIRALWGGHVKARAFGHIPPDWRGRPVFAVVRNPKARFLSAVRMFKFGNPDFPGFYNKPVWPELTIETALKVLHDERIPFERSQRYIAGNFKHHIVAQTHPYHCLTGADFILRQENLAEDFKQLQAVFGFENGLEHKRDTRTKKPQLTVTPEEQAQIHAAFAEDYAQLGYDPHSDEIGEIALKPQNTNTRWLAWSAFYSHNVYHARDPKTALPAADVDLSIFANTPVAGEKSGPWSGREKRYKKHFEKLLPEFVGRSHLAHLLACCIVVIRKTNGNADALRLFHRIIDEYTGEICAGLNTRWLVSVCDTLADHGKNPAQRGLGLSGALLANTVKLAETERRLFHPKRPWPPNYRTGNGGVLFDGVIAFWLERGDMVENLLKRIEHVSKDDPVAGAFVSELMHRMMIHNTLFKRLAEIAGQDAVPLATAQQIIRLERRNRAWL